MTEPLPVEEFDRLCLTRWPTIPWLEPIRISDTPNLNQVIASSYAERAAGVNQGWACRLCIARLGRKYGDPLYTTEEEALGHLANVHRAAVACWT